jgi:hypothetical protein
MVRHQAQGASGLPDAYANVLKNQPFKVAYIDAFAGAGSHAKERSIDVLPTLDIDSFEEGVGLSSRITSHCIGD